MTKLLRNIRQKMIEKRNIKHYFLYIIGEILLVMAGILLALHVNTLNQNRIDNNKEKKALTDLYKEFKLNKERIKAKQDSRLAIAPKLKRYVKHITMGSATYESFRVFHQNEFMFGMTNPSKGVIDALISSGDISLISNTDLKYLIADWKNQIENLRENEQILWNSGLTYIASYSKIIPIPSHTWTGWNLRKLENTFNKLKENINYKNNLVGFEGVNSIVIDECDSMLGVLENIINQIELEIKTHD